jgi:hypothetical protein
MPGDPSMSEGGKSSNAGSKSPLPLSLLIGISKAATVSAASWMLPTTAAQLSAVKVFLFFSNFVYSSCYQKPLSIPSLLFPAKEYRS